MKTRKGSGAIERVRREAALPIREHGQARARRCSEKGEAARRRLGVHRHSGERLGQRRRRDRAARLVIIPCRPGLLDIDAVQETIDFSRRLGTPSPSFSTAPRQSARMPIGGRHRGARMFGGTEYPRCGAARSPPPGRFLASGLARRGRPGGSTCAEIARLWQAIEKSVQVIKGARERAAMRVDAA